MKTRLFFLNVLILTGLSVSLSTFAQFSGGGTGTAVDPFKIKTADDLNNVRNYIGSTHVRRQRWTAKCEHQEN